MALSLPPSPAKSKGYAEMSDHNTKPPPSLPRTESLTVEFKSDRNRLSDDELVEALACLANSEGGELWLGVEDGGTPTGLHAAHQDLHGLPSMVAARTSPSLAVTVRALEIGGVRVARISVLRASSEVATTAGKISAPPHQTGWHARMRGHAAA